MKQTAENVMLRDSRTHASETNLIQMKTIKRNWMVLAAICGGGLLIVATALTALAQTTPVLKIAPAGTNQISITISNSIGAADYDLQWTPVLASPNYPWTWAVPGTAGQTNFLLNLADFNTQTAFFRTILDTNAVPLWEAADPNNPATGILKVTILSPANGATLN